MGLAWQFLNQERVDLDVSIVCVNEIGQTIDAVYYNKLTSDHGAIVHSGDQKDGSVQGYDEYITIDLSKLNFKI